jgi:aminoglycoside phosphotransferase (APT) family kinase protein
MTEDAAVDPDRLAAALHGAAGADGARWLLHAAAPRRALRATLAAAGTDPRQLRCRLRRSKAKPGRKISAEYDVATRSGGASRAAMASWLADQSALPQPAAPELVAEIRDRGLVEPSLALTAADASLGLHVQVAPYDVAFPALPRLCDPAHLRALLGGPAPGVRAVRYRPGQRHVLRVAAPGGPARYVKLYRDGGAARAAAAAHLLADVLAASGPGTAARPETCLTAEDAVLWRAVPGMPLSRWLRRDAAGALPAVWAAGAMLRAVHDAAAPAALAGHRGLDREAALLARACEHLPVLLPAVAGRLADLLGCLADRLTEPGEAAVLTHGDYKADHLLAGAGGLVLIDVDRVAHAEPALDIGKFLADLHWWCPPGPAPLAAAQARFLDGYGRCDPGRVARARVVESAYVLKLAARRPRVDLPGWAGAVTALVGHAAQLVATEEAA